VGGIIISPTRELAIQIDEVLLEFTSKLKRFTHMILIGGNNPMLDINKLKEQG